MNKRVSGRLLLGAGLSLLLSACGQTAPLAGADASAQGAEGTDGLWSYAAPEGRLTTLSLTPGENNLYFEPILAARNGWGPVEIDRSNGERAAGDGRIITLNGQTYRRGFGVHADSELRFSLQGTGATCTRFTADIGVDDEVGSRGSVVFEVYLDGVKAYDSGKLTGSSATKKVDLDIAGKGELRLVVTDAGDGRTADHADWAAPKVFCQANAAPALRLDPAALSVFHKRSATLKATFAFGPRNVSGPVDLRLVVEPGRTSGLKLQTTRVDLPAGGGPVTRDIVIAAPALPSPQDGDDPLTARYTLIASQNRRDVASAPVTITQKLLQVAATLEPATLSGEFGATRRVTLTVKVTPPLSGPFPIGLEFAPNFESEFFTLARVGPATGDGGAMQQAFDLTLTADRSVPVGSLQQDFYVFADDFLGYRLPFYGNLSKSVIWNILR